MSFAPDTETVRGQQTSTEFYSFLRMKSVTPRRVNSEERTQIERRLNSCGQFDPRQN